MATTKNIDELTDEQRNARTNAAIPMPVFMRHRLEQDAKAADKGLGPYIRDLLAEKLGIVLPEIATTRKRKYATEEERKAAQKKAAAERQELVKLALAEYRERHAAKAAEAANANGGAGAGVGNEAAGELVTAS